MAEDAIYTLGQRVVHEYEAILPVFKRARWFRTYTIRHGIVRMLTTLLARVCIGSRDDSLASLHCSIGRHKDVEINVRIFR